MVILAFAAIYFTWGSTYLAISVAIKDIPPFMLSCIRFLAAGIIMLVWWLIKGFEMPTISDLLTNAFTGLLMLAGGTTSIAWAEQHISSGVAAVTTTTLPFWFVLFERRQWKFYFSNKWILMGLLIGCAGTVLLLSVGNTGNSVAGTNTKLVSILVLITGCGLLWANGSLYLKYHPTNISSVGNITIQLITSGIACFVISQLSGEVKTHPVITLHSNTWIALLYLIIMGNIVAYMAYLWLLKIKPAAIVSTYAYVSPVIAVVLGSIAAGEKIAALQVVAFVIILFGLFCINIPSYSKLFQNKQFHFFRRKKIKPVLALILCLITVSALAQHDNHKIKSTRWQHKLIMQQLLQDSTLARTEIKLDEMTIPPGSIDTIQHQHNAQLVGYILEGDIITKMKNKAAQTLHAGEAFYEYPNEVHEYLKNINATKPVRILLYYLYKTGDSLYTPSNK